jgi:hypothetical protein
MKFTLRDVIWATVLLVFACMYLRQESRIQAKLDRWWIYQQDYEKRLETVDGRFTITSHNMQLLAEKDTLLEHRLNSHSSSQATMANHIYQIRKEADEQHQTAPQPTRYRSQYPPPPPEPSYGPWAE